MSETSNGLSIIPGESVGPFKIGMTIRAALELVYKYEESFEILVDEANPFENDTTIELKQSGFRLCFHGYTQKLLVISVRFQTPEPVAGLKSPLKPSNALTFVYKNSMLASQHDVPNLRYIYHVCGPTVPGRFAEVIDEVHTLTSRSDTGTQKCGESTITGDTKCVEVAEKDTFYYLGYCGMLFRFRVSRAVYQRFKAERSALNEAEEDDDDFIPFDLPGEDADSQASPKLDRLYVYPAPLSKAFPLDSWQPARKSFEDIVAKSGEKKNLDWNARIHIRQGIEYLPEGSQSWVNIMIGSNLQDIYQYLGVPDRVTLKDINFVDAMRENADVCKPQEQLDTFSQLGFPNASSSEFKLTDYFYNYFRHGMDLLICGMTHHVKKIVLHTNFPGHPMFGVYDRCLFRLEARQVEKHAESSANSSHPDSSSGTCASEVISVDTDWKKIRTLLGPSSPPLLVRNAMLTHYAQLSKNANASHDIHVRKYYGYPGKHFVFLTSCKLRHGSGNIQEALDSVSNPALSDVKKCSCRFSAADESGLESTIWVAPGSGDCKRGDTGHTSYALCHVVYGKCCKAAGFRGMGILGAKHSQISVFGKYPRETQLLNPTLMPRVFALEPRVNACLAQVA